MKNKIFAVLFGIWTLLLPTTALAQVFSQNQVSSGPFGFGSGVIVSPGTTTPTKLVSSTTPTVAGILATSTTASSTFQRLTAAQLSIGSLSGFLKATVGYIATALINLASDVTGVLPVANGGTASSTPLGGILKGNGASAIQSAILGSDYVNGSGVSGNCTQWGANNALGDAGAPCGSGSGGSGVATTSILSTTPITLTKTSASITIGYNGLATTSQPASSNLLTSNGGAGVYGTATSSFTPSVEFTVGGTLGAFVGGANSTLALATNGVALTKLAQIGANTILGNITGATGNITAFATSSLGIAISDTTGTLAVNRGGTNITSYTTGDILYASNSTTLTKLGVGTAGQVLGLLAGVPAWVATSTAGGGSGTVTSITFATPNSTLSLGGTNPVTTSGTINADLNLAHSNLWTALQGFTNASSTLFSSITKAYFGATATTTIDNAGNITVPSGSNLTVTGKSDGCATWLSGVLNSTGGACGGAGSNFFTNSGIYTSLSTGTRLGVGTSTPGAIVAITSTNTSPASSLFTIAAGNGTATTTVFDVSTTTTSAGSGVGIGIRANRAAFEVQATTTDSGSHIETLWDSSGANVFDVDGAGTVSAKNVGISTSSPAYKLTVGTSGGTYGTIAAVENKTATSTNMTADWSQGNQQLIQIGTAATTIGFSNAVNGTTLRLIVCNPALASAGALTFTGVKWANVTTPTQTSTANACDVWSFIATQATSTTPTTTIFGSMTPNFQ